jgi:hypothetical protein
MPRASRVGASPPPFTRWAHASVAMVCGAAMLWIAWSHPLWPWAAGPAAVLWAALVYRQPLSWLFALPMALPVLGFAPWTGWVGVDEFDILVLATCVGGHGHLAHTGGPAREPADAARRWALAGLAMLLVIGTWRGLADAGGTLAWFQGHGEALNTLRVAKTFAFVLLLWPLLQRAWAVAPNEATRFFERGVVAGAIAPTGVVLWERAVFPGWFNLSEPYRTVGWFWEMHVGGAAIDAYVVLCTPFIARALWAARHRATWALMAALSILWCYVILTTFSRGAFLGAAVALLLLAWRLPVAQGRPWWSALRIALGALGAGVLLGLVLDEWGYPVAGALAMALAAWLLWRWRRQDARRWRGLAGAMLGLLLLVEVVVLLGPDSFMRARMARGSLDYESRTAHWGRGIALLDGPQAWLLGLGWGRLPAHYDRHAPRGEVSGRVAWRAASDGDGAHARLEGPRSRAKLAGRFALTQRVSAASGYRLAFDLRAERPLDLHARVCESHLLYDGACQAALVRIEAAEATGGWVRREVELLGPPLGAGSPLTARPARFSLAVLSAGVGAGVDIDNLSLVADGGTSLLTNGDFARGGARWLPTAQSYFVPWHIDNLALEVLIEAGIVGAAFFLVIAWATARLLLAQSTGAAALQPCLIAALGGLACLGLVSSVIDVPRVALLAALMLLIAHLPRREPPTGP